MYVYNVCYACRSLCVCVLCCAMHCVSVYYLDCSVSQSCPTTPCDYTTPIPAAFSFLGDLQDCFRLACLNVLQVYNASSESGALKQVST